MSAPNKGNCDASLREAAEAIVDSVQSSRASSTLNSSSTSAPGVTPATPPYRGGAPYYYNDFNHMFLQHAPPSMMMPPIGINNNAAARPLPPPPQHRVHFAPQPLPPPLQSQNSTGTSSIPVIVSDDIVSGTKRDGWMSPVRRFFILLATFDFLFVVLMWVITIIVRGNNLKVRMNVKTYIMVHSMFYKRQSTRD